jgi:hypothetical protein
LYAPGIEYRGDRYVADAGTAIGRALGSAITNYRAQRDANEQEAASVHAIFNHALASQDANGNPLLSDDEKQRFLTGNLNTRKGIAVAIAARDAQSWKEKEAKMRWGADPREGQPQAMVLPDGSVIPGRFYVPGAHTVIGLPQPEQPTPPATPKPTLGQEVIPGWIWNGNALVPKERATKANDVSRFAELSRKTEIDDLDSQIAALRGEIAGGNVRPGPDWLPLTTTYADQLAKLQARRDSLASAAGVGFPIETDSGTGIKFYRDGNGDRKPLPGQQAPPNPIIPATKSQDEQALAWTQANPDDPRAAAILRKLGVQSSPSASPAATPVTVPQVGEVRRGFRFKGGDPGDQNNWEKM